MKKYIITLFAFLLFANSYSQLGLYLGLTGGAGSMLTHDEVKNLTTNAGIQNVIRGNDGWSAHAKAQALFGIWRVRFGYQFLYNFSSPSVSNIPDGANLTPQEKTTFFNSSQTHFFGQYWIGQIAALNLKHVKLVPGLAFGSFTGFKVDNTTGDKVDLSADTHRHFSMGAELNLELVFGRLTILAGPNYYLFSMVDKFSSNYHYYQHFIGADVGIRVNLLKPA